MAVKDKKWIEDKKRHAGDKVASMKRRSDMNDYSDRNIYLITLNIEGRKALLGELKGTVQEPVFIPSKLGSAVHDCWQKIPLYHPQVKLIAFQLMPDHLHAIIQVTDKMDRHLGQIISGFKAGCNKAYRELMAEAMPHPTSKPSEHTHCAPTGEASRSSTQGEAPPHAPTGEASRSSTQGEAPPHAPTGEASRSSTQGEAPPRQSPKQGLLFELGYNDLINKSYEMLPRLILYLRDNPRRLLMKREKPDLFRVHFNINVAGRSCSAQGNRFLLDYPDKRQVQCSRHLSECKINDCIKTALAAARNGAVHVSPAISHGEKRVMRALLDAGMPIIFIAENGLTSFSKPSGEFFNACSRGQLLIVAPWQHHNERVIITRNQCKDLNALAQSICLIP